MSELEAVKAVLAAVDTRCANGQDSPDASSQRHTVAEPRVAGGLPELATVFTAQSTGVGVYVPAFAAHLPAGAGFVDVVNPAVHRSALLRHFVSILVHEPVSFQG